MYLLRNYRRFHWPFLQSYWLLLAQQLPRRFYRLNEYVERDQLRLRQTYRYELYSLLALETLVA